MDGLTDREGKLLSEPERKFRYYKKTFFYALIVACCITIPFIVFEWIRTGHGIFLYYGDYNVQQLPFYRHCVDMVRSGNFGWDWYTDTGSNFVASYSYYLLGSPYFWLMCLFPSSFAPYLMGPMYIIKYVTTSLIVYAYLQRWVKNKDYAVLGALLYTFSGFQIYNTFFNQFHEAVALFPLLLLGMEELVQNDRRGLFAIAVCLNALNCYFMFAGQVAFCIIYFLFRFSDRSFRITLKKFLLLVWEAVLGALMGMVLFLPGALGVMGNDRVGHSFSTLKNVLVYWKSGEWYWQRYGQIFESYFFPPDIPSRVNFFHGHTERWASISGYLPLFGLTGLFALFTTKKRNWLKALCVFLILCSFVPGLNSLFFLGQSAYYARWMYMMVLMFAVATIIALDRSESRWKGALTLELFLIAAVAVPLGLLWYDNPSTEKTVDYQLGRAPFPERFWLYTAIAVAGVAVVWYLIRRFRGTKAFSRCILVATSACIVVFGCLHIANGKQHSDNSDFMVHNAFGGIDTVNLPDPEESFYRIDFYREDNFSTIDNLGIFWNYPSIECFHTVVPPSLMEFYDMLGYRRSVGSRTLSSWQGLRALTSTQYSFIRTGSNNRKTKEIELSDTESIEKYDNDSSWTFVEETETHRIYQTGKFKLKGWTYYDTQNGFDIYSNDNYLPMGFAFDSFMTETEFKKVSSGLQRSFLLCTYLIVPDDQAAYYAQFMAEAKGESGKREAANYSTLVDSVSDRWLSSCTDFTWDSYGFKANFKTNRERIVFFSVPYDGGWSAKVNGKEVEILQVDKGFMAVEVPIGDNVIEFSYRTNGILPGLAMTGAGLILLLLYLFLLRLKNHKASYAFFKEDYYEAGDVDLPPKQKKKKKAEPSAEETPTEEPPTEETPTEEPPTEEIPPEA